MEIESLVNDAYEMIKKSSYKFVNIDDISDFLKKKLGEGYTSELSVAVKSALKEHEKLVFFREDTYIEENKYHYCTGNWLAIKGVYDSPVQAKHKRGWYSWQLTEEIDWDSLD